MQLLCGIHIHLGQYLLSQTLILLSYMRSNLEQNFGVMLVDFIIHLLYMIKSLEKGECSKLVRQRASMMTLNHWKEMYSFI